MPNIVVPTLGESVVEARVSRWLKQEGDRVSAGDALVSLETEKVDVEVTAEANGVLTSISRREGEDVKIGEVLGLLDDTAAAAPPKAEAPAPRSAQREGGPARHLGQPQPPRLPRRPHRPRRLPQLPLQPQPAPTPAPAPATAPSAPAAARRPGGSAGREARPHDQAPRHHCPPPGRGAANRGHADHLQRGGHVYGDGNPRTAQGVVQGGARRGARHCIVLREASTAALRAFPQLNAEIQGDEIVYKSFYDVGIAVGAEGGLVVPVLRNADTLAFSGIEQGIRDFAKRAQDGTLTLEDLAGGTFTITNGGVFGSLLSTPILNPPQVGILGLHKIQDRPVAVQGQVVVRPMMYIALSYDHRIVDGREAVQFLVKIKELVEDPGQLLLEN